MITRSAVLRRLAHRSAPRRPAVRRAERRRRRPLCTVPPVKPKETQQDEYWRIGFGVCVGAYGVMDWHYRSGPYLLGDWIEKYPVLEALIFPGNFWLSRYIAPNTAIQVFAAGVLLGTGAVVAGIGQSVMADRTRWPFNERPKTVAEQLGVSDEKLADITAELAQYIDNAQNVESIGREILSTDEKGPIAVTATLWATGLAKGAGKKPDDVLTTKDMLLIIGHFAELERKGKMPDGQFSAVQWVELFLLAGADFLKNGDGSGSVAFDGFHRAFLLFSLAGVFEPARVEMMFEIIDRNHTGALDRTKLLEFAERLIKAGGVPADDATVGTWWLGSARPATGEEIVESWLRKYDADNNGELSRDEFKAMTRAVDVSKGVALVAVAIKAQAAYVEATLEKQRKQGTLEATAC